MCMKEKTNAEKIYETYREEEENVKTLRDKVNSFQRIFGFGEFKDVIVRCENSEVSYIRYCNQNNVQFDNEDVLPIFDAYHVYVYKMFEKAYYELTRYIEERNMIFLGRQLTIKEKIKSMISIDNTKKLYLPIQNHVANYEKILDEITDIDVKRDIKDIMITYIDYLYESFKTISKDATNIDYMFQNLMNRVRPILIEALKELKLYEGILVIDDEVIKLTTKKEEEKTRSKKNGFNIKV